MRNIRHAYSGRRNGQTIVEFALVVPVLLALLLGILEFGWLMKNHLVVANATRDGLRYAALGHTSTDVRNRIRTEAAILNPDLTDSQMILEYTTDTSSSSPTYTAWPADTTAATPQNSVPVGALMRITVNCPHHQLTGFFPFLNNRVIQIRANMTREAVSSS